MALHTIHSNRVERALHVLAVVIVSSVALAGVRVAAGPIRDTSIAPSADAPASPDVQPAVGAGGVVPPGLDNAPPVQAGGAPPCANGGRGSENGKGAPVAGCDPAGGEIPSMPEPLTLGLVGAGLIALRQYMRKSR